ncbi:MAG TPA: AMP-binding protein, partial [Candidatus Kapabacteria bacterium]|nr:AMP-binding protein [Candidatus Kapabacteria bacterium]
LGKYNEKEDVVFGAVVSGRPSELDGVESMVGLFINTIPVRIHFGEDMNFYRLLQIVQEEALLSEPYHYHPLAEIQATAVLKQNLIDHIMVFENYPITEQIEGSGREKNKNNEIVLQLANIEVFEQTNYNFNIVLGGAERLSIKFQYNGNVYDRYFVERMAAHFSLIVDQVVDQVIANLELKINQLILLSEEEKNRILYEFNNTEAAYPQTKTIHRLFEEQAGQNPDSIAVIGKRSMAEEFRDNVYTQVAKNFDIRITYKELNDKANRLASRLIEKGVQPDFIVGIMVERSLEMIIGILGILKAGGVYLPIDPEYPKERSDFMLKDSGAKILLTGEDLAAGLVMNGKASPIQTHSHHAAYIIYTSGTTGRPKGVIIEHSNVVRLFFNSHCLYDFNRGDVWTMFHSYCFDFSVWEMYGALLFGGKSVIIPKIVSQDPAAFINVLQKQRVTILNQTPSAFYSLIDEELKHIRPALNLRYIIFGGEALTPIKLKEWRQRYPGTRLINMFGITETTVHVTYKEITEKEIDINISCIGSPIPTLSTYLFDPGLKLSPIGIPGELCVGGEGVARGYL